MKKLNFLFLSLQRKNSPIQEGACDAVSTRGGLRGGRSAWGEKLKGKKV